jgi:hypothetical protein
MDKITKQQLIRALIAYHEMAHRLDVALARSCDTLNDNSELIHSIEQTIHHGRNRSQLASIVRAIEQVKRT